MPAQIAPEPRPEPQSEAAEGGGGGEHPDDEGNPRMDKMKAEGMIPEAIARKPSVRPEKTDSMGAISASIDLLNQGKDVFNQGKNLIASRAQRYQFFLQFFLVGFAFYFLGCLFCKWELSIHISKFCSMTTYCNVHIQFLDLDSIMLQI
jgi:hypothetical protein